MSNLNKINLSSLAIACNTAHILLKRLRKISKAPFISMIDEVAESVNKYEIKKIGIMGTPATINSRLYQAALRKFNIECICPNNGELKILEKIIKNIIANKSRNQDGFMLLTISEKLRRRGAEGIILGCTELPLLFPKTQNYPVFNSLEILAMSLLRNYYK